MLVDLTVKEFLNKVAGSDPVPGGGSIAALNGAVASALAAMTMPTIPEHCSTSVWNTPDLPSTKSMKPTESPFTV